MFNFRCLYWGERSIIYLFLIWMMLKFLEEFFISLFIIFLFRKKLLVFLILCCETRIFLFQKILFIHLVVIYFITSQSWMILGIQIMTMTFLRNHFTDLSIVLMLRFYRFLNTISIFLLLIIVPIKYVYFSLKFKSFLLIFNSWRL